MEILLKYISWGIIILFTINKFGYDLHMLQLNSYKNDRYLKWVSKYFISPGKALEFIVLFVAILGMVFGWKSFSYIFNSLGVLLLLFLSLKRKQKKKLVFTNRVLRLLAATLTLWALMLFLTFTLSKSELSTLILLDFGFIASFLFVVISNFLLTPVEASVNRWYYDDAKRILSKMPDLKIIGITGSYGKTSTKHFLWQILSEKYNVIMTPGSYNTKMGVVRTIRENLKSIHEVFIAEMGAKEIGDIKEICDLVHPGIGILTAVGDQHLDTFKTIENIQKTKFELVDAVPQSGFAVLNFDYEKIREKKPIPVPFYSYGVSNKEAEYSTENISYSNNGMEFNLYRNGKPMVELKTKLLGDYNVSNIAAAVVAAYHLGVSLEEITFAVKKLEPVKHRLEIKRNQSNVTIIDDSFNSNPKGAEMALKVMNHMKGNKKIIITPGMIELGQHQHLYNKEFGIQISNSCDFVILVGKKQTNPIFEGLKENGYPDNKIFIASDLNEATDKLKSVAKSGDIVLYENDLPDTFIN